MNLVKNTKVLTIILVVLILINGTVLFLLLNNQQITIKNNSKYYSVSYHPTPLFTQTLKDWKVFDQPIKGRVGPTEKIKQIVVEMTDTSQLHGSFVGVSFVGNQHVIYSSDSEIVANNKFVAKVNLDSSLTSTPQRQLNNYILENMIKLLYAATHPNFTSRQLNEDLPPIIKNYEDNPIQIPFSVTIKRK